MYHGRWLNLCLLKTFNEHREEIQNGDFQFLQLI
jgi:hypothetical protein